MAPKAFVLVPGFWEGPGIYRRLVPELEQRDFPVATVTLASTGTPASSKDGPPMARPTPNLHDDAEAVRAVVAGLVAGNDDDDQGRDVVVVAHSGAGIFATESLRDLTPAARAGKKGGAVVKLALITAVVFEEGADTEPPHAIFPAFDWQGDKMVCKNPRQALFNDIEDDAAAEAEVARLSFQPGSGWDGVVKYAAWETDLPSAYLVCERDAGIPAETQRMHAELAKSDPVEAIDAGHSAILTQPRAVADFLVRVAEGV